MAGAVAGAFAPAAPDAAMWASWREDWRSLTFASTCVVPSNAWVDLELVGVRPATHDTSVFTFRLPWPGVPLGLPTCACLLARAPGQEHPAEAYARDAEGRLVAPQRWSDEWGGMRAVSVSASAPGGASPARGDAVRPYTPVSHPTRVRGTFDLLVKHYREWGDPRGGPPTNDVRFQHSYRPPGAFSSWLHGVPVGATVGFKHVPANCKLAYPFEGVRSITMVAVGVGIAPMVQALHMLLDPDLGSPDVRVVLLYGNRTVADVQCRDQLDAWEDAHGASGRFRTVHCIGSRWAGVRMGMAAPEDPAGFDSLRPAGRRRGWVSRDVIREEAASPPAPDTRVFVCGLPEVYGALCGPRHDPDVAPGTALDLLGYTRTHVVKF